MRFLGYASWRHATTLIFETAPWARARVSLGHFFFIFQGQVVPSNICKIKGGSISSNANSREFLEFAILRPTGRLFHGDLFDPRFTRPSTSRLLFSEGTACATPRLFSFRHLFVPFPNSTPPSKLCARLLLRVHQSIATTSSSLLRSHPIHSKLEARPTLYVFRSTEKPAKLQPRGVILRNSTESFETARFGCLAGSGGSREKSPVQI